MGNILRKENFRDDNQLENCHDSKLAFAALSKSIISVLAVVVLFLSTLYKITDTKLYLDYQGFSSLQFAELENCALEQSASAGFAALKRIATWSSTNLHRVAKCQSNWFTPKGNYIEIEFAGHRTVNSRANLFFLVEEKDSGVIAKMEPNPGRRVGVWHLAGSYLPSLNSQSKIRIKLVDEDPESGWLSLRTRVNWYNTSGILLKIRKHAAKYKTLIKLSLVIGLSFLVIYCLKRVNSPYTAALLGALVVTAIQFRANVFFYHDDLQFIDRFSRFGASAIFMNHHEHVLPFFSSLFYLEFKSFAGNIVPYLAINALLQVVCVALMYSLVVGLGSSRMAAVYIATFFLSANWLLSEALQWATCQSLLLTNLFRLSAYICALKLSKDSRSIKWTLLLLGSIVLAPLNFAGGLSLPVEVLLLLLVFNFKSTLNNKKLVSVIFVSVVLIASWYLYTLWNIDLVHKRADILALDDLGGLLRFTFLGSQFGSLLRSFGITEIQPLAVANLARDYWWSAYGLLASLLLAAFYVGKKNSSIKFWVFAQCVLFILMFLPAIGRLHWGGVEYVLKLRYHTAGIVAVCILLVPLFESLVKKPKLLFLFSCCCLYLQLTQISSHRKYIDEGPLLKRYAMQLVEWDNLVNSGEHHHLYYGFKTKYFGEYPLPYAGYVHEPKAISPWSNNLYLLTRHVK